MLLSLTSVYSQIKPEYEIYLMFDSSKNQIRVNEKNVKNYTFKFFHIPRADEKKYPYSYSIDDNGKLRKGLKGAVGYGCCNITATYNNKENEIRLVTIVDMKNLINYKDYMSVDFKNVYKIIEGAKKVFVVDENEKDENSIRYKAYEVKF